MMIARNLRIAILAHSTNPRGGVVHALELANALWGLGHECVVHAPDPRGQGFFRKFDFETRCIPARPVGVDLRALVDTRVADYVRHFESPANRHFDIFHAQDSISANALATLKARGLINSFARTVHHIDSFADPEIAQLQTHGIVSADRHFVVSEAWRRELRERYRIDAPVVGNGVDAERYSPYQDGGENALRERLGLGSGPIVLAVGGVEERKNTHRLLQAFAPLHRRDPGAQLVIAGGASLLDHDDYQRSYALAKIDLDLPPGAVVEIGPVADADMPRLYRLADVMAFPSIKEGFGLVVLEAMASGVPVVTSRIAPFTEYLGTNDVEWCEPRNVRSISAALERALEPARRAALIEHGARIAAGHDWRRVGQAHLCVYGALREPLHA